MAASIDNAAGGREAAGENPSCAGHPPWAFPRDACAVTFRLSTWVHPLIYPYETSERLDRPAQGARA